jgi:hypothetical protein
MALGALVVLASPLAQDSRGTILVFDIAGNGISMTDAVQGVRFDLDCDGRAEQLAWTVSDSDDAVLVLDSNGNGKIDSGNEVVGRCFRLPIAWASTTGADALIHELQNYQKGDPLPKGADQVDAADPYFTQLQLWTDKNHDGLSSPSELGTLAKVGVTSIATGFLRPRPGSPRSLDPQGNHRLFEGSFLLALRGVDFKRSFVEFEPLRVGSEVPARH